MITEQIGKEQRGCFWLLVFFCWVSWVLFAACVWKGEVLQGWEGDVDVPLFAHPSSARPCRWEAAVGAGGNCYLKACFDPIFMQQ